MNRKSVVIILFCILTFLSGCWNYNEPERMLYIFAMGIDYKDEQFEVYVQVANFANTAKSEETTAEKIQGEVGYATGETMNNALTELYNSMGQKPYWGHLSFVILSEAALENGTLNSVIDSFIRYRETRYHTWLYTSKGPVKDLLLTTPIIDKAITLSKLADPMNSYERSSFAEAIDFRKLLIGLNEPSHEVAIPLVEVTENWETLDGKEKVVNVAGVGVVSPHDFKGFLIGDQINGLKWMNDKTESSQISVVLNEDNKLSATLRNIKVKVEPVVGESSVEFDIEVKAQATILLLEEQVSEKQIRESLTKQLKKEIKETYAEALKNDIDIYRLSEYLYRKDVKSWKKFQEKGKVELSDDSIRDITIKIGKIEIGRNELQKTID